MPQDQRNENPSRNERKQRLTLKRLAVFPGFFFCVLWYQAQRSACMVKVFRLHNGWFIIHAGDNKVRSLRRPIQHDYCANITIHHIFHTKNVTNGIASILVVCVLPQSCPWVYFLCRVENKANELIKLNRLLMSKWGFIYSKYRTCIQHKKNYDCVPFFHCFGFFFSVS